MAAHWVVGLLAATVLLCSLQNVNSQIPAACTDEVSLRSLTCCPNQCGASEGRGQCADLDLPANYSLNSTDVRYNWPHYFTRGCTCTGNYGGYDCSACKYGYYGTTCNQTQVLPRKSVQELTDSEWREYIEILNMTWSYNSGYKVVLGEYTPGTTNIDMSDVLPLYHFFVWQHHFAAKDTACGSKLFYNVILYNYHHNTKLYWKISRVCCRLYCYECAARVTMPTATNESPV